METRHEKGSNWRHCKNLGACAGWQQWELSCVLRHSGPVRKVFCSTCLCHFWSRSSLQKGWCWTRCILSAICECFSFGPGDEGGWEVRQGVTEERSVGMTWVLLPDLLCILVQVSSPLFASVSPPEEDVIVPIYLTGVLWGHKGQILHPWWFPTSW